MAIRIIDDQPDIALTREEHDRLRREYQQNMMFMVNPPSFEAWVRTRRSSSGGAKELVWQPPAPTVC